MGQTLFAELRWSAAAGNREWMRWRSEGSEEKDGRSTEVNSKLIAPGTRVALCQRAFRDMAVDFISCRLKGR